VLKLRFNAFLAMALPVVPILTAVTPLVLGAFDLYRRRNDARRPNAAVPADAPGPADALRKRVEELEESAVEQARLVSELSQQMEALARALESQAEEHRRREAKLRQWLAGMAVAAAVTFALALWALVR
jgi:flagellar biosynthesis/type III secretory pathway M-ring protein FliF/YscJ